MSYVRDRLRIRNENHKEYKLILKLYGYSCAICGWNLPNITPNGVIQHQGGCDLHHITPYREGGSNDSNNLILLCPNCHKMADNEVISRTELRKYLRKSNNNNNLDYIKAQHKLLFSDNKD